MAKRYNRRPSTRNFQDPAYKAWRKKVYSRDNYKCQWPGCNCRKRLYAHHIQTWAKYPHARFDVNNGITLCYLHHKQVTGKEEDYVRLFCELLRNKARRKES